MKKNNRVWSITWPEYRKRSKLPEHLKRWTYDHPEEALTALKQEMAVRDTCKIIQEKGVLNKLPKDEE